MAIYKNVASQKIAVFATDENGDPVPGDAANIAAKISKDGDPSAATNDTNPTELDAADHPGIYIFDLTQAETNADLIVISAVSSTADVVLDPLQILTVPGDNTALTAKISVGTGTGQINLSSGKVPATIAAGDIANDAITASTIATDAITNTKVADGFISVNKIADNSISGAKLATNCITAAKIATDAITDLEISAAAVTKIQTGLATPTNITAASGITLADGAITTVKIADGAFTAVKFAADLLTAVASAIRTELTVELARIDVTISTRLAAVDYDVPGDATEAKQDAIIAEFTGGDIDGFTRDEALKVALAALAGKASGADVNAPVFRSVDDAKDRITATTDADGNRLTVTLDAT